MTYFDMTDADLDAAHIAFGEGWETLALDPEDRPTVDESDVAEPDVAHFSFRRYGSDDPGRYVYIPARDDEPVWN